MRTAAIKNGLVVDIEVWEASNPPKARADGLARIDCPEWVDAGCRHDGTDFSMPDGSPIPKEVTDAIAEEIDKADVLVKLKELRPLLADLKLGAGSNLGRIERIEDILLVVARAVIKLYKP